MGVGACLNCAVEKETKLLKKCGSCRSALYCSTECQKISWKTTHKYSCVYVTPLPSLGAEDFDKRFNKIVDRWVHEWQKVLDWCSMAALDLANYPGRHKTHAMCMELRYTGSKSPFRTFEFVNGRVCSVEDILSKQPNLKVLQDPPSLVGHRIRYVLMFHLDPGDAQVQRFKVRAYAWTNPMICSKLEEVDKDISSFLAQTVFDEAKEDFEKRDPHAPKTGWGDYISPGPHGDGL